MFLTCGGAMGIRTPDLLHAIQRQPVHSSPSPQVTVPEGAPESACVQACCGTFLLYDPMSLPRELSARTPTISTAYRSAESCPGQRQEMPCPHAPTLLICRMSECDVG